jgi:hypothetical protein
MNVFDTRDQLVKRLCGCGYAEPAELTDSEGQPAASWLTFELLHRTCTRLGTMMIEFGDPSLRRWIVRNQLGLDCSEAAKVVLAQLIEPRWVAVMPLDRLSTLLQVVIDHWDRPDIAPKACRQAVLSVFHEASADEHLLVA